MKTIILSDPCDEMTHIVSQNEINDERDGDKNGRMVSDTQATRVFDEVCEVDRQYQQGVQKCQ